MDEKPSVELIPGPQRLNISFNGRQLYSGSSTPEKRVSSLPVASEALYLIVSPLLFYGTESLLCMLPEGSTLVSVEHNPDIYSFTLEHHRQSPLKDFEYIFADSPQSDIVIDLMIKHRCRKIIPVKLNHGYMINRSFYDRMLRISEAALTNYWKNRMTSIHMGRLWCRNIFLNCPYLKDAAFISELKTDKPVISLGAGESLEGSIEFLKVNREYFFIIAADTAVTSLLLNDIRPDLVIALESQHANLYDFYEDESFDLPVAADLTSSPELLRKIRGPLYFFISKFDYSVIFSLLKRFDLLPPVLPPLGSVGITSLVIAHMLTDNWVLFSGLDFSFIPDKYHASGSPSHIISQMRENRLHKTGFFQSAFNAKRKKVGDKSGRTVYTDLIMQSYSESLNEIVSASGRTLDFGRLGLKSAAPVFTETELLKKVASPPANETVHDFSDLIKLPDNRAAERSSGAFLDSEQNKLSDAIKEVVAFQNKRDAESNLPEKLYLLLNELDYTYIFFPDKKKLPSSDSSFLKRFLFSASWFQKQISNAQSLINHQT